MTKEDAKKLFVDISNRSQMPFQVFIGPRGDGKTFSSLRSKVMEQDENEEWHPKIEFPRKFIYLRRRQQDIQIATSETANPFKAHNQKYNTSIVPKYSSREKFSRFYSHFDNGTRECCGYGMALSTFHGLRGVSFEDVDDIVFDEFIPEKIAVKMKNEGETLFNMYETVNRNREMFGENPVRLTLIANAVDLASDILMEMRIVSTIAHMIDDNQKRYTDKNRGIYIELLGDSKFREVKANTALYKLVAGTDYADFALDNRFVDDDRSNVRKVNMNEYIPMVTYAGLYTIYSHKSQPYLYCAEKNPDSKQHRFNRSTVDMFRAYYKKYYNQQSTFNRISYDSYATKVALDSIINEVVYRRA